MRILISILLYLLLTLPLTAKPFIEGKIIGQLGNQMFQVATTYSLALDNDANPIFPELKKKRFKNTKVNRKYVFSRVSTSKPKNKIKNKYFEPHFQYAKIPYQPNMSIRGFWQTEKYFKHHRKEILELFQPLPETVSKLQAKYSNIISNPKSVAVHIRTYLPDCPDGNDFFIFLGWDYFEKMIKQFPEDHQFIVCSDRIELCKEKLSHIDRDIQFIEGNQHFEDLYLMSMCSHNIISNSSFSWWAAWLNTNPEKIVIAPPRWFGAPKSKCDTSDVIAEGWIVCDY